MGSANMHYGNNYNYKIERMIDMYLYESHMGGFYISNESLDYDLLYCDSCGDSDSFLGIFNTKEELRSLLKSYEDYYGEEYIEGYIHDLLNEIDNKY